MSGASLPAHQRRSWRWALIAIPGLLLLAALRLEHLSKRRLAHFAEITEGERRSFEAKEQRDVYVDPMPGNAGQELDALLTPLQIPRSTSLAPKHLTQDPARQPPLSATDQAALQALSPTLPLVQRALHMDHRAGTRVGSRSIEDNFSYRTAYAVHAALARSGEKQLESDRVQGTRKILDALVFGAEFTHRTSLFFTLVGASMVEGSCAQIDRLWNQLDPELRRAALTHTTLPEPQTWLRGEKLLHFAALLREGESTFGVVDGWMLAGPPLRRFQLVRALTDAERFFAEATRSLSVEPPDVPRCERAQQQLQSSIDQGSLQPVNACDQIHKIRAAQQALSRLRTRT